MLKGEDIVVLLKLVDEPADWTVRTLADETTIPRTVVHRAIKRLADAGLFNEQLRRVNTSQSEEFLLHGLQYVFPARLGGPSLGVPTAWAAEPLASHIASPSDECPRSGRMPSASTAALPWRRCTAPQLRLLTVIHSSENDSRSLTPFGSAVSASGAWLPSCSSRG